MRRACDRPVHPRHFQRLSSRSAGDLVELPERLRSEGRLIAPRPGGGYGTRSRRPDETVARARAAFAPLGITRVARVTGLDRIGIPVFMAVRPNARTLAVTQGKGVDDESAKASAIMEAVELALAEELRTCGFNASAAALADAGRATLDPAPFVRDDAPEVTPEQSLPWIWGYDLIADRPVCVPCDVVALDFTAAGRPHPFWQSSDGLASGNLLFEAVLHGLCERIERDANALWLLRPVDYVAARCIAPEGLGDPVLTASADRIVAAGLCLRLFDMTSDIAVPAFFAVIAETAIRHGGAAKHFDLSAGSGCHPDPAWAALRAVTEAAQTRITSIAGARDDFDPSRYGAELAAGLLVYLEATPTLQPTSPAAPTGDAWALLERILERLRARGVRTAIVVPVGGEAMGISVAKVLAPELENPPGTRKRAFGARALKVMMGLA